MFKLINLIPNKFLAIGAVAAVVIIALFGLDYYQKSQQVAGLSDGELLKVSKENIVDYQVIDSDGNQSDDPSLPGNIITYHYVSNQEVPAQTYNGLKEDLAKRTGNSVTFLESVKPINDKFQEEKYISQFYSGRTWQKSGDKWYQIETATTTKTAFLNQTKLTAIDHVKEFFGRQVLADTFYSDAGDGYVSYSNATWSTLHDATSGNSADDTSILSYVGAGCFVINCSIEQILRSFLPFDTSALSPNANISAATLSIYVTSTWNTLNDGNDFINIVQTTQPDSTNLTTADYDLLGTALGATSLDLTGFATGTASSTFILNATGRGWIMKSGESAFTGATAGMTYLGIREGHDILNIEISSFPGNEVYFSTSEAASAQRPVLTVTYTVIAPSKIIIDGGTIKIDGGTLKID